MGKIELMYRIVEKDFLTPTICRMKVQAPRLAAACLTVTAWADYDYIEQYGVMVTPNTEDGSLLITVKLEWTPLEELPYGQELKIGVPNGSIRDVAALTDNIERLDFDNSYMYVYLTRATTRTRLFPSPTRGCRSICTSWTAAP